MIVILWLDHKQINNASNLLKDLKSIELLLMYCKQKAKEILSQVCDKCKATFALVLSSYQLFVISQLHINFWHINPLVWD